MDPQTSPTNAPQHNPDPTTYRDRYPYLTDLLPNGGKTGIEYALVSGANLSRFQAVGWQLVKRLPAYTIAGPKGEASANLVCLGSPIPGAADTNGARRYYIDLALDTLTGLGPQETPDGSETTVLKPSPGPLRARQTKGQQGDEGVPEGDAA